jgi:Putative transposase DNA-binding domain
MYGTVLEIVDRWYPSSKTCCQCGHVQPMLLSERVFNCGSCGQIIDRDLMFVNVFANNTDRHLQLVLTQSVIGNIETIKLADLPQKKQ